MTIEEVQKAWKSPIADACSAVNLWDGKAEDFAAKEIPTARDSLVMRLIAQENMLQSHQTALDVGCGGGRFSFAMEKLGAKVVGVDFSAKMIEECNRAKTNFCSATDFRVCDWQAANLHKLGWEKCFDLVLANMTPAILSADTFFKLTQASRGWCLMVKPTRRKNAVLDALTASVGIAPDTKSLDEAMLYALELLWLTGKKPMLAYEDQVWNRTLSLETAMQEYTLKISAYHILNEAQRKTIREYLHSIAANGSIQEVTNTTIAALYWRV